MGKKSEFKSNVLTIIGITVYIWLALNMGWLNALLVMLIGLGIIGLVFRKKKVKTGEAVNSEPKGIPSDRWFRSQNWKVDDWFNNRTLTTALDPSLDPNEARAMLQKVAYGLIGSEVPQAQSDWFKARMGEFVQRDPVYQKVISRVQTAVNSEPGVVQSTIYKGQPKEDQEMARYILYFADYVGDIRREKSGRSYRLYPAAERIDAQSSENV